MMMVDDLSGNEYPVYPIYKIRYQWPQEGEHCPDGTNGTSATVMLREPSSTEIARVAMEQASRLAEEHNVAYDEVGVEVEFERWEEWCCHWFNHHTWDRGLSDADVLASFERYVWRIERLNQQNPRFTEDGFQFDEVCLMGAEDRWRWRAADDDNGDQVDPPCRCKHCKEQGVVRINH
jgi:hypothetical protein